MSQSLLWPALNASLIRMSRRAPTICKGSAAAAAAAQAHTRLQPRPKAPPCPAGIRTHAEPSVAEGRFSEPVQDNGGTRASGMASRAEPAAANTAALAAPQASQASADVAVAQPLAGERGGRRL